MMGSELTDNDLLDLELAVLRAETCRSLTGFGYVPVDLVARLVTAHRALIDETAELDDVEQELSKEQETRAGLEEELDGWQTKNDDLSAVIYAFDTFMVGVAKTMPDLAAAWGKADPRGDA